MKTFKILAALLSYPEQALLDNLEELRAVLRNESLITKKHLEKLDKLIDYIAKTDLIDLQEQYVDLFDRGRSHSLYLFEHVHGESRDRGQAMVDLAEMYKEKGLYVSAAELPDYLPLFLEFLSTLKHQEAYELLSEPIDIISTIGAKLEKKESLYSAIFLALEKLSVAKPNKEIVAKALEKVEPDKDDLEALDKEWEEIGAFDNTKTEDNCGSCNAFPNATEKLQEMVGGNR